MIGEFLASLAHALTRPDNWFLLFFGVLGMLALHYSLFPRAWLTFRQGSFLTHESERVHERQRVERRRQRIERVAPLRDYIAYGALFFGLLYPMVVIFGFLGPAYAAAFTYFPGQLVVRLLSRRNAAQVNGQVILFLQIMTTRLDAGQPILEAIREANSSTEQPLRGVVGRLIQYIQGLKLEIAFARARGSTDSVFARRMLTIIERSWQERASPKQTALRVSKLAEALKTNEVFQRRLDLALSQSRSTQFMVMLMIPVLFVVFTIFQLETMRVFWETDSGRVALLAIVLLWTTIRAITQRLSRIDLR